MFDTHCHLNFKAFKGRIEETLKKAKSSEIEYLMIVGTDFETSKKGIEIAKKYKGVFSSVGIHPTKDLEKIQIKTAKERLKKLLQEKKVLAVGETGLDYYWFRANPKIQMTFFKMQIKLSLLFGKSLIIHNRNASKDIIRTIDECWDKKLEQRCVFHCCEPNLKILEYAKKRKIYIGVDGDITYNDQKALFIKKVPLEMLVLETDSPFLTPKFDTRQKNKSFKSLNEPKNLLFILKYVSKIKKLKENELKKIVLENSFKLFNLKLPIV